MPAIPEPLEKALEKAPPQVGAYVKNVFGLLENEEELKARSTACAIAILSLWAISSFPYMAIFVAIVVALDPPSIQPLTQNAEPMIRGVLQKIPPQFIAPGAPSLFPPSRTAQLLIRRCNRRSCCLAYHLLVVMVPRMCRLTPFLCPRLLVLSRQSHQPVGQGGEVRQGTRGRASIRQARIILVLTHLFRCD